MLSGDVLVLRTPESPGLQCGLSQRTLGSNGSLKNTLLKDCNGTSFWVPNIALFWQWKKIPIWSNLHFLFEWENWIAKFTEGQLGWIFGSLLRASDFGLWKDLRAFKSIDISWSRIEKDPWRTWSHDSVQLQKQRHTCAYVMCMFIYIYYSG